MLATVGAQPKNSQRSGCPNRPAINAIIAALSAAPQGLEPAAYQYRDDAAHDAFASSYWEEIPRETYEALKSVMGGHGPKKIAETLFAAIYALILTAGIPSCACYVPCREPQA
ncbi:hypothetical protein EYR03_08885 [Xanthomonas oryzae pv. oryzae]|uniref:hypothetical protein n=1 Tax=Xanthomonas oryzae TaxID=347 RepID=UPI001035A5CD|nr:hypothetical protein [Xanthomonas oryzae]QBI15740.1 hypothetical protein EYR03_08885 [Xanthomonas oryzae pv. oryzae]